MYLSGNVSMGTVLFDTSRGGGVSQRKGLVKAQPPTAVLTQP